jgi:hypothetical protein
MNSLITPKYFWIFSVIFSAIFFTIFFTSPNAHATDSGITISQPQMVNTMAHDISNFHVGQQIGIEATLVNHNQKDRKFTYLVQVINNKGTTEYLEGFSASMLSGQSFNATQVWIPKEAGTYTVQAFVSSSLVSQIPLTNMMKTTITVTSENSDTGSYTQV